jgi:ABC-type tungstate transport system substrate-binding protein
MPSVIDRRPKGVVEICVCIFLYLLLGKENPLAETALSFEKLLTVILGSAILSICQD